MPGRRCLSSKKFWGVFAGENGEDSSTVGCTEPPFSGHRTDGEERNGRRSIGVLLCRVDWERELALGGVCQAARGESFRQQQHPNRNISALTQPGSDPRKRVRVFGQYHRNLVLLRLSDEFQVVDN